MNRLANSNANLALPLVATFMYIFTGGALSQEITLDPALSEPTDPEFTVSVVIDPVDLFVKGMEIEITFDPGIVSLQSVDPGEWITSSGLEYFFYDYTSPGTSAIHFDMAFLDGTRTGVGEVAVCHFAAVGVGDSPLTFIEVDVRDENNNDMGFDNSEGDLIRIDEPIPSEPMSFGRVKAMYRRDVRD